ncbi:MAG: M23 family metallopeptidase [Synergistaceae bacterium]|nr:M23 family metallopeptidase [Synergistaceae bacterium]
MKKFSLIILLFNLIFSVKASAESWVNFPASWDVGQAFAISITSDQDYQDPTVTWQNRTVKLDVEDGGMGKISYGLLGSYVSKVKPGEYPIVFEFTQNKHRYKARGVIKLNPKEYPKEELRVQQKMISPKKKDLPRIKKESQLVGQALKTMSSKRKWRTPPGKPLDVMTLTSHYGFARVYNGVPRNGHAASDLRAATGTDVKAPFAGTVILTGNHYFAGGSVYIDSGNGVITVFFHLSKILVKPGQKVEAGTVIAKSGSTGRVTGPHLHYGLNLAGQFVDPMPMYETSITKMLKLGQRAQVN